MNQDTDWQQEHILDQVTVSALAPTFVHPDVARHYQDGAYSRLDADLADILRGCEGAEQTGTAALIPLTGEAASALGSLNCIALIQDGQVLPLLDIEQMTTPPITMQQRVQLYHAAARTLLEAIAAIYEDRAEQRKRSQGDDNEGGHCYAH
jgi:hypothetical protein